MHRLAARPVALVTAAVAVGAGAGCGGAPPPTPSHARAAGPCRAAVRDAVARAAGTATAAVRVRTTDVCKQVEPPLTEYPNGHLAACHHPRNVSAEDLQAATRSDASPLAAGDELPQAA